MLNTLLRLFPRGALYPKPGSNIYRLTSAIAKELTRAREFILGILLERQPSTAKWFAPEWRTLYNTATAGRAQVFYTSLGRQDIGYLRQQLQTLDPNITIEERFVNAAQYGRNGSEYGAVECGGSGGFIQVTYPAAFTPADITEMTNLLHYLKPAHIPTLVSVNAPPTATLTAATSPQGRVGYHRTEGYGGLAPAGAVAAIDALSTHLGGGGLDMLPAAVPTDADALSIVYVDGTPYTLTPFGISRIYYTWQGFDMVDGNTYEIRLQRINGDFVVF